jgi:hypothetical protein
VSGLQQAVNHIHTYGSGHTDVIVTQNGTSRSAFPISRVYSSQGNASLKNNKNEEGVLGRTTRLLSFDTSTKIVLLLVAAVTFYRAVV